MIEHNWPVTGPLDLAMTLHFAVPSISSLLVRTGTTATYGLWTATGPATVTIDLEDDTVAAKAIGPGATAALAAVPRTLGLDDDPRQFPATDGLLRELAQRQPGFRLGSSGRVFDTILPTVIEQRVTTGEAKISYRRLVAATAEPAPGESGVLLPPHPEAVAALSLDDLHSLGIEQARGRIVAEVARRANRLEEIIEMSQSAAVRRLEAVSGVGPWTSAQVMGAAWGDRDAIPIGDYHLPNTVAWALAREPRATDERMLELLEPYRPWRRRALLLVKNSGIHAPRYGPKSSQSIISRQGPY